MASHCRTVLRLASRRRRTQPPPPPPLHFRKSIRLTETGSVPDSLDVKVAYANSTRNTWHVRSAGKLHCKSSDSRRKVHASGQNGLKVRRRSIRRSVLHASRRSPEYPSYKSNSCSFGVHALVTPFLTTSNTFIGIIHETNPEL